jgi:hypothetical protein
LNRLVSEGRTHHDRCELERDGCSSDGGLDLGVGRFLLVQEQLGNFVVDICQCLDKLLSLLLAELDDVRWDLVRLPNDLSLCALVVNRLHPDQIDHTNEAVLASNRNLKSRSWYPELLVDLLDGLPRIRSHTIHLVHERYPRNVVSPHLPVDRNSLTLHATDSAENHDSTVKHSQSPLYLDREVDMSGRVDQVDVVFLILALVVLLHPVTESRRRLNSDTLLTLQIHRVHLRTDRVLASHFMYAINTAGVEENTFGGGGFARVDVGGDTDVSNSRKSFPFDGVQVLYNLLLCQC